MLFIVFKKTFPDFLFQSSKKSDFRPNLAFFLVEFFRKSGNIITKKQLLWAKICNYILYGYFQVFILLLCHLYKLFVI